jgi:hypothetical protein
MTQRRGMNLYKTARAKTLLGQHKALIFEPYELAPLSATEYRINLFEADKHHDKHTLIAEDVSFQDVYDKYVKDGYMLYSMKQLKKGMANEFKDGKKPDVLDEYRNYSFVKAHSHRIPLNSAQKGRQIGGLKNIIFNESSPLSHYRICMDRAYQFIENGSPVEFRIRLQSKVAKADRLKHGDPTVWPWMHAHFPHLRPDFIQKGMPAGTEYLINPVSDGRVCQWVLAKPAPESNKANLDKRFEKIKRSVVSSIRLGRQDMLPRAMREQLAQSGNENYSPSTGMSRHKAMLHFRSGGPVAYGAEEKKRLAKDADIEKFLAIDPAMAQTIEKEDKALVADPDWRPHKPHWIQRGSTRKRKPQ